MRRPAGWVHHIYLRGIKGGRSLGGGAGTAAPAVHKGHQTGLRRPLSGVRPALGRRLDGAFPQGHTVCGFRCVCLRGRLPVCVPAPERVYGRPLLLADRRLHRGKRRHPEHGQICGEKGQLCYSLSVAAKTIAMPFQRKAPHKK